MGATAAVPEASHQQPHASSVPSASAEPIHQDKQPSSSASQLPHLPFPLKDCRACAGAQHMIKTFQKLTSAQAGGAGLSTSSAHPSPNPGPNPRPQTSLLPPAAALAAATAAAADAGQADAAASQPSQPALPCPPETTELGSATWTFLHTMAAYYPDQPTGAQKSLMRSMMEGLAEFYPCSICAEHLQQQIQDSPPDVTSASALSLWLCKIHNEVNEMLGKPSFDCSRVMERWRDGPSDGSCG